MSMTGSRMITSTTFEVSLIQGENRLEFYASSADGSWESEPATIILHCGRPLPKPELYLVFGLDKSGTTNRCCFKVV